MIDKLEVTSGQGTVIRYGAIVAWADPRASAALVSFLAQSARNLASSIRGGRQVADHIAAVLGDRDPEPSVGFAVIGPSDHGWATLLHGPVQLWDGSRWLAPSPTPGWLQAIVTPQPAVTVGAAGTAAPTVEPDTMWDLESGVVPGAGFVLIPAPHAPSAPAWPVEATTGEPATGEPATSELGVDRDDEAAWVGPSPDDATASLTAAAGAAAIAGVLGEGEDADGLPTSVLPHSPGDIEPATSVLPQSPGDIEPATSVLPSLEDGGPPPDEEALHQTLALGIPPATDVIAPATRAALPAGAVDLRDVEPSSAARLPERDVGDVRIPGAPVVAGIRCTSGHLNRSGMIACARCGEDLTRRPSETVSGARPALGSLVTDDGVVYRLDRGYLAGSDPGRDPTVSGGLARPLVLAGSNVAPSHAEVRLNGWDVVLLDRGSTGGTYVYEPGAAGWDRLKPFEPRIVSPGAHVAFGQRVVTFASPWV